MTVEMRMPALWLGSLSSQIPSSNSNSSILIKLDFLLVVRSVNGRRVPAKWRKIRNIGLINMENSWLEIERPRSVL